MPAIILCALFASLVMPRASWAQSPDVRRFSLHGLLGVFAPVGDHRSTIEGGFAIGAQIGVGVQPSLALVGGALLIQTGYRQPQSGDVTVGQFDLGVELTPFARLASTHAARRRVTPFVGLGAGVRTYDLRDNTTGTRAYLSGYGAIGAELGVARAGLRIEARDYLSRDEREGMMTTGWRNDMFVLFGLAYHFR